MSKLPAKWSSDKKTNVSFSKGVKMSRRHELATKLGVQVMDDHAVRTPSCGWEIRKSVY